MPGPVFTALPLFELDPNGCTPLAGLLSFATDVPTRADLSITDGEREWKIPADPPGTDHRIPILGMRPDRSHLLRISAQDIAGGEAIKKEPIRFSTPGLPEILPPIRTIRSTPERMEPGVTMFCLRRSNRNGARDFGWLVALDAEGEAIWLYDAGENLGDFKRLRNGNLIYLTFENRAVEIDMLGTRHAEWYAARRWPEAGSGADDIAVDAEAFHHEIVEMPNGNLLTLGVEVRLFPGYPSSETDPRAPLASAEVVGDTIVEFRRDGSVERAWGLLDVLDPLRIGYGSLGDYWVRKGIPNSRDWSRANSVTYDPADNGYIVSVRHQDAVAKIRRDDGRLDWILGTPDGWANPWRERLLVPKRPQDWFFHSHNANITPAGTLMVFDNGTCRARPFTPPLAADRNYSRAIEYAIDAEAGTVEQLWASADGPGPDAPYATFISGATAQPITGNVLLNFGGLMFDDRGFPTDDTIGGLGSIRIREVARRPHSGVVFEIIIDERDQGRGWDAYRAYRMPSL